MARASSKARASQAAIATAIATATARARARASERASAAAAAAAATARAWVVVVVFVLSSSCRVVGCAGFMGVVEGWGVMHGGVALTSAPRSRAHVRCAAWRRTQRQMSERANAATTIVREGAVA